MRRRRREREREKIKKQKTEKKNGARCGKHHHAGIMRRRRRRHGANTRRTSRAPRHSGLPIVSFFFSCYFTESLARSDACPCTGRDLSCLRFGCPSPSAGIRSPTIGDAPNPRSFPRNRVPDRFRKRATAGQGVIGGTFSEADFFAGPRNTFTARQIRSGATRPLDQY